MSASEDPAPVSRALPSGGAWIRLLLALATAAAMATVWIPAPNPTVFWAELAGMAILLIWCVTRPGSAAAMMLIAGIFAARIFHGHAVLDGELVGLVVLVPLIHQLAAVAAVVPLRSSLRLTVLLPTAMRYTGAVLVTLLVLLLTASTGIA